MYLAFTGKLSVHWMLSASAFTLACFSTSSGNGLARSCDPKQGKSGVTS